MNFVGLGLEDLFLRMTKPWSLRSSFWLSKVSSSLRSATECLISVITDMYRVPVAEYIDRKDVLYVTNRSLFAVLIRTPRCVGGLSSALLSRSAGVKLGLFDCGSQLRACRLYRHTMVCVCGSLWSFWNDFSEN